ncbi:MAG: FecR domain-containing protein [Chitinophagaceae bacterium]|nr:FecR domain-containing protein [Chitinophagaceae bacterium]MCW5927388.1 FecR domain-containing protein [Chitinophagaceae bacterium]
MKAIPPHIQDLIGKSLDGTITNEEREILDEWYYNFSPEEAMQLADEADISKRIKSRLDDYILLEKRKLRQRKLLYVQRIAAAVVLIVSISAILFYLFSPKSKRENSLPETAQTKTGDEIVPGSNRAILTLGDGTVIILDSTDSGSLAQQGNTRVIKMDGGKLLYSAGEVANGVVQPLYNTIATPRGGQYAIDLSDGTKVWLNASSSIHFPTSFIDSVREVSITGEAYFEVSYRPKQPFIVRVNNNRILVLGTHFNVMAYDNEPGINTTLLEGSLLVQSDRASQLLKPGNQVKLNAAGDMTLIRDADVEEAIAWKNGRFSFTGADMRSIMRQIERWYDVNVKFEGDVPLHFSGQLNRYANVRELLRKLELTNEVHFEIEGRTIVVVPGMKVNQ